MGENALTVTLTDKAQRLLREYNEAATRLGCERMPQIALRRQQEARESAVAFAEEVLRIVLEQADAEIAETTDERITLAQGFIDEMSEVKP